MAFELIAVGGSWGGMRAVASMLEALPLGFEIPIVLVQHRASSTGDDVLEQVLARTTELEVVTATDKEPLEPGRVYVAPADYHLLVERGHVALSTDAPVEFSRPSIDVLFESAADVYGPQVVGVLLTGANHDGAAGLGRIAAAGGFTVAQDPETAERSEMPRAAVERGAVRRVLPLDRIGPFLAGLRPGVAR